MLILNNLRLGMPVLRCMCLEYHRSKAGNCKCNCSCVFFVVFPLVLVGRGLNEVILQFQSVHFILSLIFELYEQETTVKSK